MFTITQKFGKLKQFRKCSTTTATITNQTAVTYPTKYFYHYLTVCGIIGAFGVAAYKHEQHGSHVQSKHGNFALFKYTSTNMVIGYGSGILAGAFWPFALAWYLTGKIVTTLDYEH